jgi:hypothetical protein
MPATGSTESGITSSTPPGYKSCVKDCMSGKTKRSKYAAKFERVFEADPYQEQINCLCRVSSEFFISPFYIEIYLLIGQRGDACLLSAKIQVSAFGLGFN